MRAIYINAKERKIEVFELEGNAANQLDELQEKVGGYLQDACRFDNKDQLYVNEEGQLMGYDYGFHVVGAPHPFYVGNGVIVGFNSRGNNVSASLALDYVRSVVLFLRVNEEPRRADQ